MIVIIFQCFLLNEMFVLKSKMSIGSVKQTEYVNLKLLKKVDEKIFSRII